MRNVFLVCLVHLLPLGRHVPQCMFARRWLSTQRIFSMIFLVVRSESSGRPWPTLRLLYELAVASMCRSLWALAQYLVRHTWSSVGWAARGEKHYMPVKGTQLLLSRSVPDRLPQSPLKNFSTSLI